MHTGADNAMSIRLVGTPTELYVDLFQSFPVLLMPNNGTGQTHDLTMFYNLHLSKNFFTFQNIPVAIKSLIKLQFLFVVVQSFFVYGSLISEVNKQHA